MTCVFCDVLAGQPGSHEPHNTILREWRDFVVVPALGPLVDGHVLLISRTHAPSLAALGRTSIAEYCAVVSAIRTELPIYAQGLLQAEHGATSGESGAACISHVHVNLMPDIGNVLDLPDGECPRLGVDEPLENLASVQVPYLLLRSEHGFSAWDARGSRSQYLRSLIARHLGVAEWDWAVHPRLDVVESTMAIWGISGR
jgi:diadenosine tetraphosphate (Ap4A) HIT family hydrolase